MLPGLINARVIIIKRAGNRPRSIYQYSSMAPRLKGQASIFGIVFFAFKSLLGRYNRSFKN